MLKRKKEISEMEKAISFVMQEYHLPYCKAREMCINRRDEILAQCKMERIKSLKNIGMEYGISIIETNGINFNTLMSRWAEGKVQLSFMFELRYGKE
jgi:hypothetical protein